MHKGTLNSFALLLAVAFIAAAISIASPRESRAGQAGEIRGYMWSDTIGWISTNCTDLGTCGTSNYKLQVDASGNITGYAWSEHIGWVSANETTGCPSSPCAPRISGGAMSGWLKAVGASGGWDGWISLSGSGYGVSVAGNGTMSGYAWGSDVVGWVSFAQVTTTYLDTCTVTTVCTGGALYDQAANCTQTFVRNCVNGCASGTSCNPECAPTYSCSGDTIQYTGTNCATTNVTTCTAPSFCQSGQSSCVNPPPEFVAFGNPADGLTGHLQVRPAVIRAGDTTKLYWNVENVQSCTVTENNPDITDSWTGGSSGASGRTTSAINQVTIYTLSCTSLEGVTPASVTESETIVITPVFEER